MNTRIDVRKYLSSSLTQALLKLSFESQKHLEHSLLRLVEIRASQINGCAYCLDMHTKDARAAGETEQRIYTLTPGARRRSSPIASVPRSSGPRP